MFKRFLNFIASLRLTVVFLTLALLLVFIGTIAQVDEGLYAAQNRWFRSLVVFNAHVGSFYIPIFPGGYLIGGVLLINLFAAHATRFKFTKKKIGIFLTHAGLVLLFLGQFATDMLSNESQMQLFEGESKNYSEAFHGTELALVDKSNPDTDTVYSIDEAELARVLEVKDSRLPFQVRVKHFWPNAAVESRPPADAVAVAADHGLYTNLVVVPAEKSGMDGDDVGAAVLIEILNGKNSLGTYLIPTQTQRRQTFKVGEREFSLALLYAPMMGGNTLVVSDAAGSRDSMVMIPESDLSAKTELTNKNLPVTFHVKKFWPGCRFFHKPGPDSVSFNNYVVTPMPLVTDTEHRNIPGAIVELAKDGKMMGSFLVSADFMAQHFSMEGKHYEIALRFTREYYPFTLTLLKATHEKYKGTDIPKNFASRIRVENPSRNEARETVVYMNNPLRYAGLTFFQYQMAADEMRAGQKASSTFQVVHNPSWLTPYLSCIMVAAGLIIQFMTHLIGFAMKRRPQSSASAAPAKTPSRVEELPLHASSK